MQHLSSFSLAAPPAAPDRTGKKLWVPFPMILASNPDRAVTVRERDPTYPRNDVPGGPRGALVDEVNGDSICDQIPLPHGHGSVNFRFSMIPSSLKFQLSPVPGCEPDHSRKKLGSGLTEILLLSGSLLGTWAHIADKSSRSPLCRTRLRNTGSSPARGPVGFRFMLSVNGNL